MGRSEMAEKHKKYGNPSLRPPIWARPAAAGRKILPAAASRRPPPPWPVHEQ